jgi:hypothetical protein
MKKLMMVLCCVCAVAAVPAAQTATPEKTDKMAPKAGTTKGAMTVTGCVAAGSAADQYMLTNVVKSGETGGGQTVTYSLMGGELKPHVGHKVAVTGTMDAKAGKGAMAKDATAGAAASKDATAAKDSMAKSADKAMAHDTLHVTSVKMVAATCP